MQITGNTPLNLQLPLDAINLLLQALGSQPYEKVVGVVNEIQRQASSQLQELQAQAGEQVPAEAAAE